MKKIVNKVRESRLVRRCVSDASDLAVKIRNTHPIMQLVAFSVCMAVIFFLAVSSFAGPPVRRSVFFFEDAKNGAIRTEIRYIPRVHGRDARLGRYVGELLLGSMNPDYAPLFNPGVRLERCFARGHEAYIELSPESLVPGGGVTESKKAVELFKKNVCTNFRNVARIYLYVDGTEVYSENPYVDAGSKNKKR